MMKGKLLTAVCLLGAICGTAQQQNKRLTAGKWKASLQRNDGKQVPFVMDIQYEQQKLVAYIVNGQERIKTKEIVFNGDSATISMPVFESYFKIRKVGTDSLNGVWISGAENGDLIFPFAAHSGAERFVTSQGTSSKNIQGKWAIQFTRPDQTKRPAIGTFTQKGNMVSGSILTPSSDYRYLEGTINNDSLFLSTFDGSHAFLFAAKINGNDMNGVYYSGANSTQNWAATRDEHAALPLQVSPVTEVKQQSDGRPDFSFRSIDGKTVSIKDEQYKGKVVILQIMGSWCPNCMDETAFLSEYYRKNKDRGVEVIALAYELSTDDSRSLKSLQKFQQQFNITYPIVNTGVKASDPDRAEKTIPQITALKVFPTTIFVDKEGKISEVKTNFYGPAAKEYHTKFKNEFEETVNRLLNK